MPNKFTGEVSLSEVKVTIDPSVENGLIISKRGGKRKGAGRPPAKTAKKAVTIKMKPDHVDKFNRICKGNGNSQAGQLVEWIEEEGK